MARTKSREFTKQVIDIIAKRAGYICSNPDCNIKTIGPADKDAKGIGQAAHIYAVSENGPRFDPLLSNEYISSQENAIWLCCNCHTMIDYKGNTKYTVELLKSWKSMREEAALQELGKPIANKSPITINDEDKLKTIVMEAIESKNNEKDKSKIYSFDEKNIFSLFKESNNYLFNKLYKFKDKNKPSELCNCMNKVLDWFVGRGIFPRVEIESIYNKVDYKRLNTNKSVINSRRNAFIKYYDGNISSSNLIYSKLYNKIGKKNYEVENWIYDDYLIDGRNILYTLENVNRRTYDNKYAISISRLNHNINYPSIDRLSKRLINKSIDSSIKYKYKSRNTIFYGIGLEELFDNIQKIVYISILYGSISNLNEARQTLKRAIIIYADLIDDENLYKFALKLCILTNDYKNYKLISEKISVKYRAVESTEFINELLNLRESLIVYDNTYFDIFIFEQFGRILSEKDYDEYEKRVFNILNSDYVPYVNSAIKSLSSNIPRLHRMNELFEFMSHYVKKGGYRRVQDIINYLDYSELNENHKIVLKNIIKEIINSNEYIIIIDLLIEIKNTEHVSDYDTILLNKESDNNILFELSKSKKFPAKNLKIIINEISNRIDDCLKTGIHTGYSTYYNIPSNFFKKDSITLRNIIEFSIFPLCKKSLSSSRIEYSEKIKLLRTLMYIIYFDISYKSQIEDIISNLSIKSYDDPFTDENKDSYIEAYNLLFQYLFDKINIDELLSKYIIISENNNVLEEIRYILDYMLTINNLAEEKLNYIYILITQNLESDNEICKIAAIKLSKHLFKTKYFDLIYEKLYELSIDSKYDEMRAIAFILKDADKRNTKIKQLCNNIKNNRNFNISYIGKKYLN